jgi:hypothetical protein
LFSSRLLFIAAIIACVLLFTAVSSQQSTMRTLQQQQPVVVHVPVGAGGSADDTMLTEQCVIGGASTANGGLPGDACAHIDVASSSSLATSGDGALAMTARRSRTTKTMEGGVYAETLSARLTTNLLFTAPSPGTLVVTPQGAGTVTL